MKMLTQAWPGLSTESCNQTSLTMAALRGETSGCLDTVASIHRGQLTSTGVGCAGYRHSTGIREPRWEALPTSD